MAGGKAKGVIGLTIIAIMLAIWVAIAWYAITLILGIIGITGGAAAAITIVCEISFVALAVPVIRLVSDAAYGEDRS